MHEHPCVRMLCTKGHDIDERGARSVFELFFLY